MNRETYCRDFCIHWYLFKKELALKLLELLKKNPSFSDLNDLLRREAARQIGSAAPVNCWFRQMLWQNRSQAEAIRTIMKEKITFRQPLGLKLVPVWIPVMIPGLFAILAGAVVWILTHQGLPALLAALAAGLLLILFLYFYGQRHCLGAPEKVVEVCLQQLQPFKEQILAILDTLPEEDPAAVVIKPPKVDPAALQSDVRQMEAELLEQQADGQGPVPCRTRRPCGDTAFLMILQLETDQDGACRVLARMHRNDQDILFTHYMITGSGEEVLRWLRDPASVKALCSSYETLLRDAWDYDYD